MAFIADNAAEVTSGQLSRYGRSQIISVSLHKHQVEILKKMAAVTGLSVSRILRDAIKLLSDNFDRVYPECSGSITKETKGWRRVTISPAGRSC